MRNTHRGFTLLELFVGLAIATILLAVAGPQLSTFSDNNKLRTGAREFQAFILLARTEAVTRNSIIKMTSTGGDNWAGDIIMCKVDFATDTCANPNSEIIHTANIGRGDITIKGSNSADPSIIFTNRGRLSGAVAATTVQLAFCDGRGVDANDQAKILTINVTGRPNIQGLDVLAGDSCNPA